MNNSDLFIAQDCPSTPYSGVVEGDSRVAYAYLLENGKIIGDVWIYNLKKSPVAYPWEEQGKRRHLPYMNPRDFVRNLAFSLIDDAEEVDFKWRLNSKKHLKQMEVWIRGSLHATISPGSKPGKCRLAAKDGPLALTLKI